MSYVNTNNEKYVIRGYQFGYNDECFYVEGKRIESTFSDKALAEKSYKALEVKAARDFDLNEVEGLFDGDDKRRKACNQFVMDTCGIEILDEDGYIKWGIRLPEKMSDDDVLKFVDIADMNSYQLLAFDANKKFYAVWIPKEDGYYLSASEDMDHFVYEENQDDLIETIEDIIDYNDWNPSTFKGTLEEISHSPNLLKHLIKNNKKINYSEKIQTLKISGSRPKPYIAVNELLLNPLFEIHSLSLQKVIEIEKKLKEDYIREWS